MIRIGTNRKYFHVCHVGKLTNLDYHEGYGVELTKGKTIGVSKHNFTHITSDEPNFRREIFVENLKKYNCLTSAQKGKSQVRSRVENCGL